MVAPLELAKLAATKDTASKDVDSLMGTMVDAVGLHPIQPAVQGADAFV